jgi:anti-sigma factor RsiW
MNCEETQRFLASFLNGKLSGAEAHAVRSHLASCANCASRLSRLDRIEIFPAIDEEVEPASDLSARFHSRLERHRQQQAEEARSGYRWLSRYLAWGWPRQAAAAASLVLLLAVGIYFGSHRTGPADQGATISEIGIAENLPLLQDMGVIENLDLLEDFDVIHNLPIGSPVSTGRH